MAPQAVPRVRWQNEAVVGEGLEPMHTPLQAFESAEHALRRTLSDGASQNSNVISLTPARWAFHYAAQMADAPPVRPGSGYDTTTWGTIEVCIHASVSAYLTCVGA